MPSRPVNYRAVTQRDIARALGVSNATVSLALRDIESLPRQRREEVKAAAKRMGYRANAAAAELACYKSNSRVVPIRTALAWIDAHRTSLRRCSGKASDSYREGAKSAALNHGYSFEEFHMGDGVPPVRMHRHFQKKGIRGILLPTVSMPPDWETFPWRNYSVVRFGRSSEKPFCHGVDADHMANAMLAFDKMRERGYRRIGFISAGEESMRKSKLQSEAGIWIAHSQIAGTQRVPVCDVSHLPELERTKFVVKWVRDHGMDGVLTDMVHLPEMLTAGGLRVPEDLGLACTSVAGCPGVAGIHQTPEEIGKAGLSLLNFLITCFSRDTPKSPRQLLVAGLWVDGGTLPDRR